jgi:hypothetical protein
MALLIIYCFLVASLASSVVLAHVSDYTVGRPGEMEFMGMMISSRNRALVQIPSAACSQHQERRSSSLSHCPLKGEKKGVGGFDTHPSRGLKKSKKKKGGRTPSNSSSSKKDGEVDFCKKYPKVGDFRLWPAYDGLTIGDYLKPNKLHAAGKNVEVWIVEDLTFPEQTNCRNVLGLNIITEKQAEDWWKNLIHTLNQS